MEDSGRTQQVRRILWARGLGLPAPKRNDWHMAWHGMPMSSQMPLSFNFSRMLTHAAAVFASHAATPQADMGWQQKASLLATAAAV